MADEDAPHANGNVHEENGHVPEIELIIKVSLRLMYTNIVFSFKSWKVFTVYSLLKLNAIDMSYILNVLNKHNN